MIHKLLNWIERVDRASQTGAPRPAFETDDHESIFPEDDEDKWWLTDVQNRKEPAAPQAPSDEDGPPSSEGEHVSDEDKMVSDEDPMSDDECEHAALGSQEDIVAETQRPSFVPRAHWPRSESER